MEIALSLIAAGVVVILFKKWQWKRGRPLSAQELFDRTEHEVEMMKVMISLEFLPILEDLVVTMTDLLREMEDEGRRQR